MAGNRNQPAFRPNPKSTVILAATAASQNIQVQTGNNCSHLRVYNPSATLMMFIEFGDSNAITSSVTTGTPVPPGAVEIFSCPYQFVAVIGSGAGPTNVYLTPGHGL
jgi:hypothetical protein